jgi:hypothetical protein
VPVLNAETTTRIGPLDVREFVANDAAGSALDATFVGKEHPPIVLWNITIRRTAIDALLPLTLQTDVPINDADVGAIPIDVEGIETEFSLYCRRIEYSRSQ